MPSITNLRAQLQARITNSGVTLTCVYPPPNPVATGTSPTATAPLSPLTGQRPLPTKATDDAEPEATRAELELPCLWLFAETVTLARRGAMQPLAMGWVAGAEAVARVVADESVTEATFLETDHIRAVDRRWKVIKVTPIGASFAQPSSYAVWVTGAAR